MFGTDSVDRRLRDIRTTTSTAAVTAAATTTAVATAAASTTTAVATTTAAVATTSKNEKKDADKSMGGLVLVRGGLYWEVLEKPAYIFAHPNSTSEHMMKHGIFEQGLIQWCRQYLTPNTDLVDIGAHSGTYALNLSPCCRQVHAFEAQRMTYYQLCGGIALNQYANIWPHHCALGDEEGLALLNITSTDGGGSTLDQHIPTKQHQTVLRQESCLVKTLDSFKLFEGKIGLIKIDVEGHELAVLRGAKETLAKNNHPPILFEAWPDEWYKPQKLELFQYITHQLKYTIKPAPHSNNMFIALYSYNV
jgi:FkbM family methyltransferase